MMLVTKRRMLLTYIAIIIFSLFMFCRKIYGGSPSNVRVTNVRGTQFTISWTSVSEETGQIKYGTNIGNYTTWTINNDDRGPAPTDDIHHVTLTGLTPSTTYYYEIISGSTTDNNGGNFYSLNTGPALTPAGSCLPAGKVFKDQSKSQFAYDSIVYVTILGATVDQNSAPESVLVTTASNGYWFVDLVNFRTKDYSAPYAFVCGTSQIFIEAQGGNDGTATMTTEAIDFSSTERPDLILIESYTVNNTCSLSSGLNLYGHVIQIPQGYTSYNLIADLGTKDEIYMLQKYDFNSKKFKTTTYKSGYPNGDIFNIVNGEGYIVYSKVEKSIYTSGLIANPGLSLMEGPNFVSIPRTPSLYTTYKMLSYLGSANEVSSIQGFDRKKGTFETAFYFYGKASGNNVKINNCEGYIINMKVNKYKSSP